jgi:UDP-2,4-diacetamido-2,4,6-trideoxy-beta-L-altropyranose hydrolase
MKIAFRTDASSQIGTGHFMRCLTLAEELKKQSDGICFISRNLPLHLSEMLEVKEIKHIPLVDNGIADSIDELAHASWLGVSQAQDAKATVKALSGHVYDWMVVDHYALDVRWESLVRPNVKKIMAIDDLADRDHDCDILLDQNYYADMQTRYNSKVPAHCQLLLGPSYALLREEFRFLREQANVCNGEVKKVLVFFGGVDVDNYTLHAIHALSEINFGLHVDIVIGAQHPFRELIEKICAKYNFVCHVQVSYMAKLMAEADLAIGAGGTSIWERCCLGLPTISICTAENQRKQIVDAAEDGYLYAPLFGKDIMESIRLHIQVLLSNPPLIRFISNAGMKLVDGKGTLRIASLIESSLIEIRNVTPHDSKNIFEWRNNRKIRDVSRDSELITWDEHQKWFYSVLADSNRQLLIGMINENQIGVVRFDVEKDVAEVSIYLVPEKDYFGKGKGLLLASEEWLKINHPEIKSIDAIVMPGNEVSKRLFLGSGYRICSTSYKKDL